ncbi:hypothetical protein DPEC_G00011400 [Dallia pectoralis]|uniref:Uncharacterized protein n=1 Tax=Dallia pectoralis TaxID=75939 RepID=A0ACC2HM58_DALPE|nr:hypothetical protein DPEC_G00011400 [Dallia pectoralis]
MNSRDGDNPVPKQNHRGHRLPKLHGAMKKNRTTSNTSPKDAPVASRSSGTIPRIASKGKDMKPEKAKRLGKSSSSVTESQNNPSPLRKLSDASNISEDLSKDSGCASGKVSTSDSSSDISDCNEGFSTASEGNQLSADTPSSENGEDKKEISSVNAQNTVSDISRPAEGNPCIHKSQNNPSMRSGGDGNPFNGGTGSSLASSSSPNISGASRSYSELAGELVDETHEDLVRENEDLRSDNEYLKDEIEEMRCEMLEMRDLFLEDEMFQLQELRLQLEQANKTCRILQYRLRKAERRSLRVAKTGQVDGEMVRSLEHDVKVTKNVSLRLHNELESVQQRNSRLEWENERLRENQQEMEVTKQVLQAEIEKARESSLKRKNVRSQTSKVERKPNQDDSADLKCQLRFAKEESALMCKKLTKIMSESESMREELAKYRSAYGDVDAYFPEGTPAKSSHTREAEVKVHLRLVEEEATLLSRRIVELEVENRGLRAEMTDMRSDMMNDMTSDMRSDMRSDTRSDTRHGGTLGEEEDESQQEVPVEHEDQPASHDMVAEKCDRVFTVQWTQTDEEASEGQRRSMPDQSQMEREGPLRQAPGNGPEAGQREPHSNQQSGTHRISVAYGLNMKQHKSLIALRDHACLVTSAIQLLTSPAKPGHSSPALSSHRVKSYPQGKAQPLPLDTLMQGHLYESLELLHAMLLALLDWIESLVTPGRELGVEGDPTAIPSLTDTHSNTETSGRQETSESLQTAVVKDRVRQSDHLNSCSDPMMKLTLQVLWVLHQGCLRKTSSLDGKEQTRDPITMAMLHRLLQYLGSVLRDSEDCMGGQDASWTADLNGLICKIDCITGHNGVQSSSGLHGSTRETQNQAPGIRKTGNKSTPDPSTLRSLMKNWCYLSQEAAQMDQDDPFKTWDHPIMPLSFPNLDLDQLSQDRSHTAPEKTVLRVYCSPPSARRLHLSHLSHSTNAQRNPTASVISARLSTTQSSLAPLCLRLSANLSDDMKEMTASLRQAVHSSSPARRRGTVSRGWTVNVSNSGTQTQLQMVSVGLQTDGPLSVSAVRGSPLRLSARAQQISTSLDRLPGRTDRPKSGSTSPKLYRRHSASASPSSISSSSSLSSSTSGFTTTISNTTSLNSLTASSATVGKERVLWGLSHRGPSRSAWAQPTNSRIGSGLIHQSSLNSELSSELSSGGNNTKHTSKPGGANRYGLVTEFLRKMSGRADKPASGGWQKGKCSPNNKTPERVPSNSPTAPAHRNDSVTRIVNQRFMKQKEEAENGHKEDNCSSQTHSQNQAVRRELSLESNVTLEDGNYDCTSSRSLSFCFSRSSRSSSQPNSLTPTRLQRHRYTSAVNGGGSGER